MIKWKIVEQYENNEEGNIYMKNGLAHNFKFIYWLEPSFTMVKRELCEVDYARKIPKKEGQTEVPDEVGGHI